VKIFAPLYKKVMLWSEHKYAPWYLYSMAFIESIFWPVPVDIMLAPMALTKPHLAWRFAFWSTVFSVLGGAVGYYLGYFLYDPVVLPFIEMMGYQDVSAGMMGMVFAPFLLTALVGRGLRFFLVAGLMVLGGKKMEAKLSQYIDILGWGTIIAAIILYLILKY